MAINGLAGGMTPGATPIGTGPGAAQPIPQTAVQPQPVIQPQTAPQLGTTGTEMMGVDNAAAQAAAGQNFDPAAAINALSATDLQNIVTGLAAQPNLAQYVNGLGPNSQQPIQLGGGSYPAAVVQLVAQAAAQTAAQQAATQPAAPNETDAAPVAGATAGTGPN